MNMCYADPEGRALCVVRKKGRKSFVSLGHLRRVYFRRIVGVWFLA